LKSALESGLNGKDGIRSISASTVTGNVLVYFDPQRELPEIAGVIEVVVRTPRPRRAPQPPPGGGLWEWITGLFRPAKKPPRPDILPAPRERVPVRAAFPAPEPMALPWHAAEARDVAAHFAAARGLTTESARNLLARYGPNALPAIEPRSAAAILLGQFQSVPVALLMGSAVLSIATGGIADAIIIGAVVAINAAVGFFTELHAERTIAALLEISEPPATVLRDGAQRRVPGDEVVPGDTLLLGRGDHVSADARVIECGDFTVDEAALTGESMPLAKDAAALPAEVPLAERLNMVYRGTIVTGGCGVAVVVATGRHTEIGRVQALIAASAQPETPLQRQMGQLGRQLAILAIGISGVVFGVGLLRGFAVLVMVRGAVSLAIAAVPEGLPTVAMVALANGVRALLRHKVLVRRLDAVEALGSVSVLCFDKTGTLTHNRMSVVHVVAGGQDYKVGAGLFFAGDRAVEPAAYPELAKLLEVCTLCSEAELAGGNGEPELLGSPTETALLRMAQEAGTDVAELRREWRNLRAAPRAEGRPYMATWHAGPNGRVLLAMKGSPADVLGLCRWYARAGRVDPLTDAERKAILERNARMAGSALRVLGVACLESNGGEADPAALVWLGLVGLMDPPRQGLREVLADFRRAGVKPVILTGDQGATARAVGQALDLTGGEDLAVMNSTQLDAMDDAALDAAVEGTDIFSRVSPGHKLRIVQSFQRLGHVVAMTGDGVNDGPALKAADVGITLGRSGTRVARGVADIVLADDDIAALLPAIREGRAVYLNLRKAVRYIAASNTGEVLSVLAPLAAGAGQPLNPRQLLWTNLISDVMPELGLALDTPPAGIMSRPPNDPHRPIVARGDYGGLAAQSGIISGAAVAAYAAGLARYGAGPRASSMAFLTLNAAALLHGFTARSVSRGGFRDMPPNPWLSGGALGSIGLLALAQVIPGLRAVLGNAPLTLADAAVCAAAAAAGFFANEARKPPSPALLPAPAGRT
jgi:Ca2+-transporting ATPase